MIKLDQEYVLPITFVYKELALYNPACNCFDRTFLFPIHPGTVTSSHRVERYL